MTNRNSFIGCRRSRTTKTVTNVASPASTFVKSVKTPEEFVKSYAKKPNSYNEMLVANSKTRTIWVCRG
ncbi:MAG TPA: hypothetical protein VNI77_03190 [Nitrososphaera sp.]|nr:hypothetical protein [Nitrososphaera sp.]